MSHIEDHPRTNEARGAVAALHTTAAGRLIVNTGAGPVELDEAGIPPELLDRARRWFVRQVQQLERVHGPHWPAVKDWLADYLRAELRELIETEGKHAS